MRVKQTLETSEFWRTGLCSSGRPKTSKRLPTSLHPNNCGCFFRLASGRLEGVYFFHISPPGHHPLLPELPFACTFTAMACPLTFGHNFGPVRGPISRRCADFSPAFRAGGPPMLRHPYYLKESFRPMCWCLPLKRASKNISSWPPNLNRAPIRSTDLYDTLYVAVRWSPRAKISLSCWILQVQGSDWTPLLQLKAAFFSVPPPSRPYYIAAAILLRQFRSAGFHLERPGKKSKPSIW